MTKPLPSAPETAAKSWCMRVLKGWRCQRRLDRRDASSFVHSMWDQDKRCAALAACTSASHTDPQNVYAYVHAIDLAILYFRDFRRARSEYSRGMLELRSAGDRDLLDCFYLYKTCLRGGARA